MDLIKKTIEECFSDRVKRTPHQIFIKTKDDIFTWNDVDKITDNMKFALREQGVKKGDRVGLYGLNSPSWIISFVAIQKLGAVAVLINSCYKEKEVANCIKIADISHVFYTGVTADDEISTVIKKLRHNNETRNIKTYNIERSHLEWEKFVQRNKLEDKYIDEEKTTSDDLACILFTSGTTNDCKGVMLTHHSLVNNAKTVVEEMRWNDKDVMCLAVPLFHCFGVTVSVISSIVAGITISLLKKYKTSNVCKVIQNDKCTILNGVPSMFLALIKNPQRSDYDLSSLKSGIIAGSPIYEKEYVEICENLEGIRLQTSYGLTEASPCVSISKYDDSIQLKSISAGKVIDNIEVKIRNLDTNEECVVGEAGEIYVKGYNVTSGYLTKDPVVCDAVQKDGWLKTGDIGYLDENNYLYVVGRRKNLIIRGGENISPTEIEKFIKEVKNGINVHIIGKKSEVLQEEIVACIEGDENPDLVNRINAYLEENISKYKIPGYYLFIKKFPTNQTGKINEKELKSIVDQRLGVI